MYSHDPAHKIYNSLFSILKNYFNDYDKAFDKLLEFLVVDFSPRAILHIEGKLNWFFENKELAKKLLEVYDPKIIKNTHLDHLGALYCTLQSNKTIQMKGQFITPYNVSKMIAQMTLNETEKAVTVLDPACGTGSMLLAAHETSPNSILFGVDIDLRAVRTCITNFAIRNIKGYILCADSLRHDTMLNTENGRHNWQFANNWYSHWNELKSFATKDDMENAQCILNNAKEQMALSTFV